jgi:hypothetical protein
MEIERLLQLETTEKDKIEMIISNNFDLIYKGKAAVTIDKWDKLSDEILAWKNYESEKLVLPILNQSYSIIENEKRLFGKVISVQVNTGKFWVKWSDGDLTLESNIDNCMLSLGAQPS